MRRVNIAITRSRLALSGREEGMKQVPVAAVRRQRLDQEAAVPDGLQWLASVPTHATGLWSLRGPLHRRRRQTKTATSATAMALFAFQGAGHTPRQGPLSSPTSRRGWNWLLKSRTATALLWQGTVGHHRFYSQAQSMIAICELCGMTQDSAARARPLRRSVAYAVKAQDSLGGWRYQPGFDSDSQSPVGS